jgi:hypothetical protein
MTRAAGPEGTGSPWLLLRVCYLTVSLIGLLLLFSS